ncbi:MAG: hypothetical protein RLZZ628_4051 [Bacteroidota bacterium]
MSKPQSLLPSDFKKDFDYSFKPVIFVSEYQTQFPFMVEIKKNISKEILIQQIASEIHEIPLIYLQTLYGLVHTFKENILAIPPQPPPMVSPPVEEALDWDLLLKEIYLNRQKNNAGLLWQMT